MVFMFLFEFLRVDGTKPGFLAERFLESWEAADLKSEGNYGFDFIAAPVAHQRLKSWRKDSTRVRVMNNHVSFALLETQNITWCWNRGWSSRQIRNRCRVGRRGRLGRKGRIGRKGHIGQRSRIRRRGHIGGRTRMGRWGCERWLDGIMVNQWWGDYFVDGNWILLRQAALDCQHLGLKSCELPWTRD